MIVRAMGFESAASAVVPASSGFADVPPTHWAAGYVAVARAAGVVNGTSSTTFEPDAPVTHAQAIAMLVRALGRESGAAGDWPVGYIIAGLRAGVFTTGDFSLNGPITRGEAAQYIDNCLTIPYKVPGPHGQSVVDPSKTFLASLGCERLTGTITGVGSDQSSVDLDGSLNVALASDVTVSGLSLSAAVGNDVEVLRQLSTGRAIYIGATDTVTISGHVDASSVAEATVTVAGTVYQLTDGTSVVLNGGELPADAAFNAAALSGADVTLVVDRGNEVRRAVGYVWNVDGRVTVKAQAYDHGAVVTRITVLPRGGATGATYSLLSTAHVVRNGEETSTGAIQVGDDVRLAVSSAGIIVKADAYNAAVSGQIVSVSYSTSSGYTVTIKVGNEERTYKIAADADGEPVIQDPLASVVAGLAATLRLDRDGRVTGIVQPGTMAPTRVETVASATTVVDAAHGQVRTLVLANGVSYRIANDAAVYRDDSALSFSAVRPGDLVSAMTVTGGQVRTLILVSPRLTRWTVNAVSGDLIGLTNPDDGEYKRVLLMSDTRYSLNRRYHTRQDAVLSGNSATVTLAGRLVDVPSGSGTTSSDQIGLADNQVRLAGPGLDINPVGLYLALDPANADPSELRLVIGYDQDANVLTLDRPLPYAKADASFNLLTPLSVAAFDAVRFDSAAADAQLVALGVDVEGPFITVRRGNTDTDYRLASDTVVTVDGRDAAASDLTLGQTVSVAGAAAGGKLTAVLIEAQNDGALGSLSALR